MGPVQKQPCKRIIVSNSRRPATSASFVNFIDIFLGITKQYMNAYQIDLTYKAAEHAIKKYGPLIVGFPPVTISPSETVVCVT